MENSLTEKREYFAQHYGQQVLGIPPNTMKYPCTSQYWESGLFTIDEQFLQLKPFLSITDEEAIEVAKIYGLDYKNYKPESKEKIILLTNIYAPVYQYLQSKGYALPFRNYSVGQLIEMGWVKLKE